MERQISLDGRGKEWYLIVRQSKNFRRRRAVTMKKP
jgi:hypothetical protein